MKTLDQTVRVKLGQIITVQDILRGKPEIISLDEIIALERSVKEEIWVATYDLSYDLDYFIDVGAYNIQRGIIYVHFIPPDLEITYKELLKKVSEKLTQKNAIKNQKVKYVPREFIPLNIVLYDPISQKQGYIYVPESDVNLFLKFDRSSFHHVRNYFNFLLNLKEEKLVRGAS